MLSDLYRADIFDEPPRAIRIELTIDRGGLPVSISDIEKTLDNVRKTARIILAIDRLWKYGIGPGQVYWAPFSKMVLRAWDRDNPEFTEKELRWLFLAARVPEELDFTEGDELSVYFLNAVYVNPTKISLLALGVVSTLISGTIVWAGVQVNHQIGSGTCVARADEIFKDGKRMLEKQAKLEGFWTPEVSKSFEILSKSHVIAVENCTKIIGMPRFKIDPLSKSIDIGLN